jgi:hypothetical protein
MVVGAYLSAAIGKKGAQSSDEGASSQEKIGPSGGLPSVLGNRLTVIHKSCG